MGMKYVPEVGDTVFVINDQTVTSSGKVQKGKEKGKSYSFLTGPINITNDVGGTSSLPNGEYLVRIIPGGGRAFKALLLDQDAIDIARKIGTTGVSPEHYKQYTKNPQLAIDAAKAAKNFNPQEVYVVPSLVKFRPVG